MSGKSDRTVVPIQVTNGQAQLQYAPAQLAYRILNLEATPEGTLRAVRGACPYEPDRGGDQYGGFGLPGGYKVFGRVPMLTDVVKIYGVFHAGLLGGKAPTLVVRAGDSLYMHAGWRRSWKLLYTGLTDEGRAGYPDLFAVVNGNIIWTNGLDPALVISHDGQVVPLGFDRGPGAPEVDGCQQPGSEEHYYANSEGYSHPGRVGSVGDFVDNNDGALLASRYRWAAAWEDEHGNISPLSNASREIAISVQRANAWVEEAGSVQKYDRTTKVDDLPRQFTAKLPGGAPPHAVAWWLYRTPDANRNPDEFRVVERFSGSMACVYADNIPDSRLGPPAKNNEPVPRFGVMTSHAGSLVIASGARVLRSEVGYPGSFDRDLSVIPDPDGAVITGLASHAGRLIAFTERAMVDITDPTQPPVVMARGIGCVAPRSVCGMPDGTLVWLSRDAFYGWHPENGLRRLSDPIHRLVKNSLAKGSLSNAVAIIEPESREYRCAVARAGSFDNELLLCFDGLGWREVELGYKISDMCVTDDSRYRALFAGGVERLYPDGVNTVTRVDAYDVYGMNSEVGSYTDRSRTYSYTSAWLRADDSALAHVNVHNLYVGMIDEIDESVNVYVYRDGARKPDEDSPRKLKAVGTLSEDLIGDFATGSGSVHARRLFWRQITVELENAHTWSFKIESDKPFHLASFAPEMSYASMGGPNGRVPFGEDE
ncbi:MAG: hypothetical protein P1V36_00200 [Planctomycetota bacterium]|nr:hypothetical protein [Planctomycetota bacterium]